MYGLVLSILTAIFFVKHPREAVFPIAFVLVVLLGVWAVTR